MTAQKIRQSEAPNTLEPKAPATPPKEGKSKDETIDRIGVAGPLGDSEQGRPLRQGKENRERVGAGGPVGES